MPTRLVDLDLFSYDQSLLDSEVARWAGEPEPVPAVDVDADDFCACRKHPSGTIKPPNPNCMNCKGTGSPITREVHGYVFDGKGNFTATSDEPAPQPDPGDSAQHVRF